MPYEFTSKRDLVSVIIPTFGRSEYILRCINSVISQTYKNIEIIVIDDNGLGTENQNYTENKLKSLIDTGALKYVVRDVNGGGALARNDGINIANGKYITFLDDDDEYLEEKIERQVYEIIKTNKDIVLCGALYINDSGAVENYKGRPYGENLADFVLAGRALTPMIMATKTSIINSGGFDSTPRFQDHIFMLKLLGSGATVCIIQDRLYRCHRHSGERISRSPKSLEGYLLKHAAERKYSYCLNKKQSNILNFSQRLELLPFKKGKFFWKEIINLSLLPNGKKVSLTKVLIKILIGRDRV